MRREGMGLHRGFSREAGGGSSRGGPWAGLPRAGWRMVLLAPAWWLVACCFPGPAMARPGQPPSMGLASPRLPTNTLEVQLALSWRGFRAGSVDGVLGPQTRAALKAFQRSERLPVTGLPDRWTLQRLPLGESTLVQREVSDGDLSALGPVPATWAGKSLVARLPHESLLEALAEQSAAHPKLLRQLNPSVKWEALAPGDQVWVPRFRDPAVGRAAKLQINLAGRSLQARDEGGRVLLHAPCSIGKVASARPRGTLRVVRVVNLPTYHFDPARFPESEEARGMNRKLVLPPGPNNPVGVAWIGLDLPGHGIHGTPWPEKVGRTESHGCFRLSNWDVACLVRMAWPGLEVEVVEGE